jgi:uncharacterized protein YndB with AHSA1/START domain
MPTANASRVIRAPQKDVWALLSDVTQARRWNKYWAAIEFASGQTYGVGTRFVAKTEGGDSFTFDICDWEAPQRIAFCPVREPGEGYGITLDSHVFEMRPVTGDECVVTITARASASGLRGRIVAMFFWAGHQKDGLNAALDALQAVFQPELFADDGAGPQAQEALPD